MAADAGGEPVSRRLVLLLAVTCGAAVANLYDVQPLLNVVGDAFGVSDATVGLPVTCAQLGYLAGPALLVPLSMAGFSALWTSIAFLLAKPPYGYGEGVIGLFGSRGSWAPSSRRSSAASPTADTTGCRCSSCWSRRSRAGRCWRSAAPRSPP